MKISFIIIGTIMNLIINIEMNTMDCFTTNIQMEHEMMIRQIHSILIYSKFLIYVSGIMTQFKIILILQMKQKQ